MLNMPFSDAAAEIAGFLAKKNAGFSFRSIVSQENRWGEALRELVQMQNSFISIAVCCRLTRHGLPYACTLITVS